MKLFAISAMLIVSMDMRMIEIDSVTARMA
jgi:hypothetical protein